MFKRSKRKMQMLGLVSVVAMGIGQAEPVAADTNIEVMVNGDSIRFLDAIPTVERGRVSIPVRAVTENMGIKVNFDDSTREVTFTRGSDVVKLTLDSKVTQKNGIRSTDLDVPAKSVNGRTFVPLRFIGEAFGSEVVWHGDQNLVEITLGSGTVDTTPNTDTSDSQFTDPMLRELDSIAKKYGHYLGENSTPENFGTREGTEAGTTMFILRDDNKGYTAQIGKAYLPERQKLMRDQMIALGIPLTDQFIKDIESFHTNNDVKTRIYGKYKVDVMPSTGAPGTIRVNILEVE